MDENTPLGIELPDDLSTLDDRGLESLREKVAKAFDKINAKEKVSAAELAEMGALADQRDLLTVESDGRSAQAADAQAERERLAQRMAGEGGGEGGDADPADPAPVDPAPADPAGDPAPGDADPADPAPGDAAEVVTVDALAASMTAMSEAIVAALGTPDRVPATTTPRPTMKDLADAAADRHRPREAEMPSGFNIVASSDIQGVSTGSHLNMLQLDDALMRRARAMGVSRSGRGDKALVASIEKTSPVNDVRGVTNKGDILTAWSDAHNVQALVASGGWCGPSENIYDFACDFEAMPDEVDLPTLTTDRAGVNVPDALLLGDVMGEDGIGMTWTEADDIAAADPLEDPPVVKVCFKVPCPDWDETRLEAFYTCVQAGNLADRSFPEGTARTRDLALLGHAHRLNAAKLTKMEAQATAVAPILTDLTAAEAVLAGVEFTIARSRDAFFMSDDQILEVVLPRWVRHAIRRDLARRNGVEFQQVSNDEIKQHFADIGARVQFVTNWHMLAANATSYPNSVLALVYPAGAFTLLDGGTLDIAVIRDSVLNATNDHTLLFFEEFWQLLTRCAAFKVTIPICAWGGNAPAAALDTCPIA